MDTLIKLIEEQQIKYSKKQNKKYLKDNSQFFTPNDIALKMIRTIDIEKYSNNEELYILEPAAGFGILIVSLIYNILNLNPSDIAIKKIVIDAYETEKEISKTLDENLSLLKYILKQNNNIALEYNIINGNFILLNESKWKSEKRELKYDIIISNPPFDKINQTSKEAIIMKNIIFGQPNIYSLFIAMSLKLLKNDGTYVVLSPRNYLNGTYTIKLREFILKDYSLIHLHSFEKRSIFSLVSQEIIIATYVGTKFKNNDVEISYNGSTSFTTEFNNLISDKKTRSLMVPKSKENLKIFDLFSNFNYKLKDINLKISVGPVVQFREKVTYKDIYIPGKSYPLLVSIDILENNIINYYKRKNIRKTHNKSISIESNRLIKNSNYVIARKVTSKNCTNLLIAAVLHKDYFDTDKIGLDNNLIYFHKLDNSVLKIEEAYGIYCFISSSYFRNVYSLINGTHTINISDFDNIRFPSNNILTALGKELLKANDYSEKKCNEIFEKFFYQQSQKVSY